MQKYKSNIWKVYIHNDNSRFILIKKDEKYILSKYIIRKCGGGGLLGVYWSLPPNCIAGKIQWLEHKPGDFSLITCKRLTAGVINHF